MGKYLNSTSPAKHQRGVVLFIALIALVAMTLAGIALMRSVDTANVIAGNFAFKESAIHATDRGTEIAMNELCPIDPSTGKCSLTTGLISNNGSTQVNNQYYPVRQAEVAGIPGMPATVDWSAVTKTTIPNTGNDVQYVVERMCDPIPASGVVPAVPNGPSQQNRNDVTDYCITAPQCSPGVSINAPPFCVAGDISYRVTARVTGPRGTVSVVQSIVTM